MQILIVDDEKSIVRMFKMILSCGLPDCRTDLALNGFEAVDAFRKGQYDIILLDIQMPEKDGYSAFLDIKEICRAENLAMPYVIFCTGYSLPQELENEEADSSFCVLRKPITPEKLLETFRNRQKILLQAKP